MLVPMSVKPFKLISVLEKILCVRVRVRVCVCVCVHATYNVSLLIQFAGDPISVKS